MIFDRNFVSKNFRCCTKSSDLVFDRTDLDDFVNYWKAIFVEKYQLTAGKKIGLGYSLIDIYYFGAIIAAAELGLKLVILDSVHNPSKLSPFYPLDLFIKKSSTNFDGLETILDNSMQVDSDEVFDTYEIQYHDRFQDYIGRRCNMDDTLICCTSSGTTGKPKVIEHTHQFMASISQRNSQLLEFRGRVCHIKNLYHGSSLATFWLPALHSDLCTEHHIFPTKTDKDLQELAKYCHDYQINHLQLPNQALVEQFFQCALDQAANFQDLTIYTLSYIDPDWKTYFQLLGKVKVISMFGSNETSGPILTNTLSSETKNFCTQKFEKRDDFYDLEISENQQLTVSAGRYFSPVTMQDRFEVDENSYVHLGRSDMFRIDDIEIDAHRLLTLPQHLEINGSLIFDPVYQLVYFANWGTGMLVQDLKLINQHLSHIWGIEVSHSAELDQKNFIYGIKLDHEMVRQHFRKISRQKTS